MRMAIKEKEVYEENFVLKKNTLSMIHRDISCKKYKMSLEKNAIAKYLWKEFLKEFLQDVSKSLGGQSFLSSVTIIRNTITFH